MMATSSEYLGDLRVGADFRSRGDGRNPRLAGIEFNWLTIPVFELNLTVRVSFRPGAFNAFTVLEDVDFATAVRVIDTVDMVTGEAVWYHHGNNYLRAELLTSVGINMGFAAFAAFVSISGWVVIVMDIVVKAR